MCSEVTTHRGTVYQRIINLFHERIPQVEIIKTSHASPPFWIETCVRIECKGHPFGEKVGYIGSNPDNIGEPTEQFIAAAALIKELTGGQFVCVWYRPKPAPLLGKPTSVIEVVLEI